MAFRCTRIWCVRPVAIATWMQDDAAEVLGPRHARHGAARPARPRRHLLPVVGIAADRRVDPLAGVHHAPDQREVLLLDFAVVELARQLLVRGVVLGHHHDARRAAIEPVDDARPQLAADAAQIVDVVQQRVHQVPLLWPAAGCTTIPAALSITTRSASS